MRNSLVFGVVYSTCSYSKFHVRAQKTRGGSQRGFWMRTLQYWTEQCAHQSRSLKTHAHVRWHVGGRPAGPPGVMLACTFPHGSSYASPRWQEALLETLPFPSHVTEESPLSGSSVIVNTNPTKGPQYRDRDSTAVQTAPLMATE